MNKGKEQIQQTKRELIGKAMCAGHQKVHSNLSLHSMKGLTQKLPIRM